jgi:hypothetical protein
MSAKEMQVAEQRFVQMQRPRNRALVEVVVRRKERDEIARVEQDHGRLGSP